MNRLTLLTAALLLATAHAAELTLEKKPFFVAHQLSGSALPDEFTSIRLDAEEWNGFTIDSILPHGSRVKKGEVLVAFEAEAMDKKTADVKQRITNLEFEISSAEIELEKLEKTTPEQLARAERRAEVAAEELAYFRETDRALSKEKAEHDVTRREQILASYQEELKQLLQMYEADDLTEHTEEIILKQQRDKIASAEFSLRVEQLEARRMIDVSLPRKELALVADAEAASVDWEAAERELPLALAQKKQALEELKISLQRENEALAGMEKDRQFFQFKAPADGMFYHGSLEGGKWETGELVKALVPGGTVANRKVFATFIPDAANLAIHAFPKQADAADLKVNARGFATPSGQEDVLIPAELASLSEVPNPDRSYHAVFAAEWPEGAVPAPGEAFEVNVISHAAEEALVVPADALRFNAEGWTVEVKLADGDSERRVVSRGKTFGEEVEITAGLEAGQVIIVP